MIKQIDKDMDSGQQILKIDNILYRPNPMYNYDNSILINININFVFHI